MVKHLPTLTVLQSYTSYASVIGLYSAARLALTSSRSDRISVIQTGVVSFSVNSTNTSTRYISVSSAGISTVNTKTN